MANPAATIPSSVIGGAIGGAIAGWIVGGPVGGALGGCVFGAVGHLGGSVVQAISGAVFSPCAPNMAEGEPPSPLYVAGLVISVALGIIASIAAGWGALSLMGITASLGSVIILYLTMAGVALAIGLAIGALAICCFCGIASCAGGIGAVGSHRERRYAGQMV